MSNKYQFISDRKIDVALIGCGRISRNHIKSILLNNQDLNFKYICDNDSKRLETTIQFIKEFSDEISLEIRLPNKYEDYLNLLEDCKLKKITIDLIILATPSGLHASQCISAAEIGLNVCTEKPIAVNWKDGCQMVKTCSENNVHLFVMLQNRLNSTLKLLKKQINKKRFGKISLVSINVFWHRSQSYYNQDDWRGTWEMDGGALMNQASHYVDLLYWLIGPVKTVNAFTATLGRDIEVEDTAVIQLQWENGALGSMSVSMLTYPENLEGSITILGEKGTVRIGGKAVNDIEVWKFSDPDVEDELIKDSSYETTSVYGFGHPLYYKKMIDFLRGKTSEISKGEDGLKNLELLTASYLSSKLNKVINLPLDLKY